MLEIRGLVKRFGGVSAVSDLDMTVREGEIHALIGPNGSGKTTTINVISGIYRADGGSVRFRGEELTRLPAHAIAERGITRTFQNIRLFPGMSVLENVLVGRHTRLRTEFLMALVPNASTAAEERAGRERALELLHFVGLAERSNAAARSLAYGDQRRLEIARALAAEPALLLLDEPAAGMNPIETERLVALLHQLRARGTTLLLIEHDMNLVMSISDRITVLNFGTHIAEGSAQDVAANPDVITAYLGGPLDLAGAR
ncbi:MAG: ABC transporter ATP-binding protein [Candidatus Eremiobacteraeota bacterium]|nr:ABC transporter ATP-binding protein [Candidatus Eremiobacteraeota bacterium]